MNRWTLLEYIQNGKGVLSAAQGKFRPQAKVELDGELRQMVVSETSDWSRKQCPSLGKGMYKLKLRRDDTQRRIFLGAESGCIVFLLVAKENDDKLNPRNAETEARRRFEELKKNGEKVRPYDWS